MTDGSEHESIFARTSRGAGWMLAWRAATRILGLVSTLILVRLLATSDFGLVALAMSCVLIIDAVASIGVEDALVREKASSRALFDTAFTFNVIRACVSAVAIAALASPAASFLGEPALTPLILLLAATTAFEGFSNIGTIAFRREMDFHKEFQLQIVPRLAAVVVTLILAAVLRSYWALIAGIVLQKVLRVPLSYAMHPYRPRLSLAAWRELVGFSAWAWAIMLAIQLRERAESILIGRMLDTSQVGLYEAGKEVALLPTSELIQPACHAVFSGFAQSRNAGGDPASSCLRVLAILALLSLPAGFGLSAIAAPLVRLAFGPNWLESIPVVQAFGIAGAFAAFGYVCTTLLRAHGLMRLSFHITILSAPARIAILLVMIPLGGLPAAAAGITAVTILGRCGTMMVTFRHFNIRFADLARRVWRSVAAVCVMAGALWWAGLGWNDAPPDSSVACAMEIAGAIALAATAYIATVLVLWALSGRPAGAESDAMDLARPTLSRLSARFQRS